MEGEGLWDSAGQSFVEWSEFEATVGRPSIIEASICRRMDKTRQLQPDGDRPVATSNMTKNKSM